MVGEHSNRLQVLEWEYCDNKLTKFIRSVYVMLNFPDLLHKNNLIKIFQYFWHASNTNEPRINVNLHHKIFKMVRKFNQIVDISFT